MLKNKQTNWTKYRVLFPSQKQTYILLRQWECFWLIGKQLHKQVQSRNGECLGHEPSQGKCCCDGGGKKTPRETRGRKYSRCLGFVCEVLKSHFLHGIEGGIMKPQSEQGRRASRQENNTGQGPGAWSPDPPRSPLCGETVRGLRSWPAREAWWRVKRSLGNCESELEIIPGPE